MREIKFRAWNIYYKEIVGNDGLLYACEGKVTEGNNKTYHHGYDSILDTVLRGELADKFILMQYTGLKDKNGKEIYEGDIVCEYDRKAVVKSGVWNCSCCHSVYGFSTDNDYVHIESEVIGNIYENPELMEIE